MNGEPQAYFRVVGWEEFQHYKDRDPPWIKLHRRLLDNYGWGWLPDVSKAHLVGIWLLAARYDNKVPHDAHWVRQRIGAREPVDLEALRKAGFIEKWESDEAAGKRENWPTRHIKKAIKEAVWERDKGKCQQCGERDHMLIEYDHVVPISRGGEGTAENLQLLCRSCNRRKRNTLRPAEQLAPQLLGQSSVLRSLETEGETEGESEGESEKSEAAPAARSINAIGSCMAAVRMFLYAPDGKPPAGWDESRDASIIQRLLARGESVSTISDAIEGIRIAVNHGQLSDWTPPARPGDKLTMRILYHTKSGVLPTWTVALTALNDEFKGAA